MKLKKVFCFLLFLFFSVPSIAQLLEAELKRIFLDFPVLDSTINSSKDHYKVKFDTSILFLPLPKNAVIHKYSNTFDSYTLFENCHGIFEVQHIQSDSIQNLVFMLELFFVSREERDEAFTYLEDKLEPYSIKTHITESLGKKDILLSKIVAFGFKEINRGIFISYNDEIVSGKKRRYKLSVIFGKGLK